MVLKNTVKEMETLLIELSRDLIKAEKGNKAAAQRVRTLSIQFAKVAKVYRKESIASTKGKSKKKATTKKVVRKKSVKRKKVAKKKKTTRKKKR